MLIMDELSHRKLVFGLADYVADNMAERDAILEVFEGADDQAVGVFKAVDPVYEVLPLLFNYRDTLLR